MNWKIKAALQLCLSNIPFGERFNYVLQRCVTRSLPGSDTHFLSQTSTARKHREIADKYCSRPIKECVFYEFGAGWELIIPLAFYAFGVENQILVDIRNLLRGNLINSTIEKFQQLGSNLGLDREPHHFLPSGCSLLLPLSKYYGIQYLAPYDARNTGIDACSIDFITSTNTLEHIPPKDIQMILKECHHLLKDDGVMSFFVDYSDHYAHFDRTITVYNFLQHSEKQWSLFSPSLHYQNRLRHRDYLDLFHKTGFEVVD